MARRPAPGLALGGRSGPFVTGGVFGAFRGVDAGFGAAKIAICGTLTSLTVVNVPQTTIMTPARTINGHEIGGTTRCMHSAGCATSLVVTLGCSIATHVNGSEAAVGLLGWLRDLLGGGAAVSRFKIAENDTWACTLPV
jgi:hypothetical protein